jgi:hypothetical protein
MRLCVQLLDTMIRLLSKFFLIIKNFNDPPTDMIEQFDC